MTLKAETYKMIEKALKPKKMTVMPPKPKKLPKYP